MPIDRNTIPWLIAVLMAGVLGGLRARRARREVGEVLAALEDPPPPRPPRDPRDSPLPPERYADLERTDLEWMNPRPVPLDAAFTQAVRRFAAAAAEERARMRDAIDKDGRAGLFHFAANAALFGLRERSLARVRDGLAAVAMTDPARLDSRNVIMALGTLYYVAGRIGANTEALFHQAAALAEGEVRYLITRYPHRPAEQRDLGQGHWLREVQLPDGPVFMQWGNEPYGPTRDLVPLMVDFARVMAAGQYRPCAPWLAYPLSPRRLDGADGPELWRALRDVRAGANILGFLRPGVFHDANQSLHLFLVEARDERDARTLLEASRRPDPHPAVFRVGVAEGRYFVLVAGGSHVRDIESYETPERMARFAAPVADVLRRHGAASS